MAYETPEKCSVNSNTESLNTVCCAQLNSYAKGADAPIVFRHYVHSHDTIGAYNFPHLKANHDRFSLFIFVDVSFNFLTERNLYSPRCGQVLTIRSGEPYNVYFYGSQILNYYQIDLPTSFFENVPSVEVFSTVFMNRSSGENNLITLTQNEQSLMFHHLKSIEETVPGLPRTDALAFAHLVQIFYLLNSNFSADAKPLVGHRLPTALKMAVKYISENYLTLQSVAEVAEYCHVSTSYLCRIFKKHLETSPVEYINGNRISYAKYLLKNGYNVTETCYSSGFNSYNYFITTFKNTVGKSPGEFAKSDN